MKFNYIQKSKSALSEETLRLLETIDSFQYQTLNPDYQTLGDIHRNVTVEVVDELPVKEYTCSATVGELRHQLECIKEYNQSVEQFNCSQSESAGFTKTTIDTQQLEECVRRYSTNPDDTEVEWKTTVEQTGYYTRDDKNNRRIVLKYSNDKNRFAACYIHEMMHAFYDSDVEIPLRYAEYAEEPLTEYITLLLLYALYRSNPTQENAVLMKSAYHDVDRKQHQPGIAHYGMGAYLFEWYAHIKWEKIFRTVHSKKKGHSLLYSRLKSQLSIVSPEAADQDTSAKRLYGYLTALESQSALNETESSLNPRLSASAKVIGDRNCLFRFRIGYIGDDLHIGDSLNFVRGIRFVQDTSVVVLNGPSSEVKCIVTNALIHNLQEIQFQGAEYELTVSNTIEYKEAKVAEIEVSVEHLPGDFIDITYSIEMTFSNAAYCKIKERQAISNQGMKSEPVRNSPQLIEHIHLFRLWHICYRGIPGIVEDGGYSTIVKINGELRFFTGMTKEQFISIQCDADQS